MNITASMIEARNDAKMEDLVAVPVQTRRTLNIHLSSVVAALRLRAVAMTAPSRAARPHGAIRSQRERLMQTLWFEALGIVIVSPLFAHFAGPSMGESLIVLTALSVAMMCWSALYNTAFDLIEVHCTGRVASDRPHGLRVLHTIGNETTALIVTWPLMVALTPLTWLQALAAEIGLTLAYTLYGYLFHLGFDRLRPVRADAPGDPDFNGQAAGQSSNRSNPDFAVARFGTNGAPDASFGPGGKLTIDVFASLDSAENVAVHPDGKIVVSGFATNGTSTGYGLVRILP